MTLKRLISADKRNKLAKIDESEISYEVQEGTMRDIRGNEYESVTINIIYQNEYVGYLIFTVYPDKQQLYIEQIEVWDVYQGQGLAQYLYKKFGEIYRQNYMGWPVGRKFENPKAEQAFKRAIEKGWVPPEAYTEEYIDRTY